VLASVPPAASPHSGQIWQGFQLGRQPIERNFVRWAKSRIARVCTFSRFVEVATLIAAVSSAITLILLLQDRPKQANIAAFQLLQNYLQSSSRAQFNQGQNFALETLVKNRVSLRGLDAHEILLSHIDIQNALLPVSSLRKAHLIHIN
jgi:hypothetical protein